MATFNLKLPSASVEVPFVVPFSVIETPGKGMPFESVTTPFTGVEIRLLYTENVVLVGTPAIDGTIADATITWLKKIAEAYCKPLFCKKCFMFT
ncbi:hypothetical protein D3C72_1005300 [compost metagenome]